VPSTRGRAALLAVLGVLAALSGGITARARAEPAPAGAQQEAIPRVVAEQRSSSAAGMPAVPVILLGVLMLSGLGAVALLVKRLDLPGAKRARAALACDVVEEELQQMIADADACRRATRGA
jgi:hypothetical protein